MSMTEVYLAVLATGIFGAVFAYLLASKKKSS